MKHFKKLIILVFVVVVVVVTKSCSKDIPIPGPKKPSFTTTPYTLQIPEHFPPMPIPPDNPMTHEGVALGRMLFYENRVSNNSILSCNSCHLQEQSFSSGQQTNVDINGSPVARDVMPLVNVGWSQKFSWDGRSNSLESKIEETISNQFSMNSSDEIIKNQLGEDSLYQGAFYDAFEDSIPSLENTSKALAQFLRTLISGNSRYDEWFSKYQEDTLAPENQPEVFFDNEELAGFYLYGIPQKGCNHCHGGALLADNKMHNNALFEEPFDDPGLGAISGDPFDNGKFRAITLRNVELTGPYMHDGSIATLQDVLGHYSGQMYESSTVDPLIRLHAPDIENSGGIQMTISDRNSLIAFMKTFTDESFTTNPDFSNPFE